MGKKNGKKNGNGNHANGNHYDGCFKIDCLTQETAHQVTNELNRYQKMYKNKDDIVTNVERSRLGNGEWLHLYFRWKGPLPEADVRKSIGYKDGLKNPEIVISRIY